MILARVLRCGQGLTTFVRRLGTPQEPHRRQETRFKRRFGAKIDVNRRILAAFSVLFRILGDRGGLQEREARSGMRLSDGAC